MSIVNRINKKRVNLKLAGQFSNSYRNNRRFAIAATILELYDIKYDIVKTDGYNSFLVNNSYHLYRYTDIKKWGLVPGAIITERPDEVLYYHKIKHIAEDIKKCKI